MPWKEVDVSLPFPIPQSRKCPDCQVSPGSPHMEGCDIERCAHPAVAKDCLAVAVGNTTGYSPDGPAFGLEIWNAWLWD